MDDEDREFILQGISNGFDIIDPEAVLAPIECGNYNSTLGKNFSKVDAQIKAELAEGNYIKVKEKPLIVSALGAIPKQSGGIRLIHDCSRPCGQAVNNYAEIDSYKFQTVEEFLDMVKPNCFMGKIDLKSAYRSIKISKASQRATGLKWCIDGEDTYLADTCLPFGAKASPGIFHRITQAVKWMMARKGFHNIVVYLDDFAFTGSTREECMLIMNTLIGLLRKLGFHISWDKVEGPSQQVTFLGVRVDSVSMSCSIPEEKITKIRYELVKFADRKRASKNQLQSLVGKLSWVARVVPAGRIYLRALIAGITKLKLARHKLVLTTEMLQDIQWWFEVMPKINGYFPIRDRRPIETLVMDACNEGGGVAFAGDWAYINWQCDLPQAAGLHINYKEVLCAWVAAKRWGHLWVNRRIIMFTDSILAKGMLDKAKACDPLVVTALKELFMLSVIFNFHIIPKYIPGKVNHLADCISRLHDPKVSIFLPGWLFSCENVVMNLNKYSWLDHMSLNAFCVLYLQGCPLMHGEIS